jgi:predicted amidohydrolase YtcJ
MCLIERDMSLATDKPHRIGAPFQYADRLMRGGKIFTLNPRQEWAEAIGISGNLISFVGTNEEGKQYIGPRTNVVDLAGQFLMPGFNDAHIHFAPHMLSLLGSCGITTAQTISDVEDLSRYITLAKRGSLSVRLEVRIPLERWREFKRCKAMADETCGMVRIIGLKAYADGMFRHKSAYLIAPYVDSNGERGALSTLAANCTMFDEMLDGAVSVDANVSTHSIGDAGVRFVLDRYERLIMKHHLEDHRLRIIHASLVSPTDFVRFGDLGLIAEVNPYHAEAIPWLKAILGSARTRWAFAFRNLKTNGATLCFGSDYPGPSGKPEFPIYPLLGVRTAVLHPHSDERLTLKEALVAYTVAPAWATNTDVSKGTLEVGKLADLVILSENPFDVDPAKIASIRVIATLVGGKVVFCADVGRQMVVSMSSS